MTLTFRFYERIALASLLLAGCQEAPAPGEKALDDNLQRLHFLEQVKNEYPLKAGEELLKVEPPQTVREANYVELSDLGLVFRRIALSQPIEGNQVLFVAETEITNAMYAVYLAATNQRREDGELVVASQIEILSTAGAFVHVSDSGAFWRNGKTPPNREDHPVTLVTVPQAIAFAGWLNDRYKLPGTFRLPLEEEWLAAAYGVDRRYPWGDSLIEWTSDTTEPVKSRPQLRTPEGLYGMWGNVTEVILTNSDGYGGTIDDVNDPFITKWQGASYRDADISRISPRKSYWGYTHSNISRSDERGFRVVYVPGSQQEQPAEQAKQALAQ